MKLTLAWLILAVSAVGVAADPTSPGRDRSIAAVSFADAERAFADEDYPEALRLFRAAFSAAPNDSVRFNIAVCLERLGRFREAGIEYDAAAASTTLTDDVRARASEEAKRVRARLGRLEITGTPSGAVVQIDGVTVCALPCSLDIDSGRREITARAGAATDRVVVDLARGSTKMITLTAVTLQPRRAPGPVTWIGAGATVLGTGAAILFGLRARSLHDDYLANPTVAGRDDGMRARDWTNVSIAVAVVGVAAIAFDLLVLSRRPQARRTDHPVGMIEARF